MRHLRTIGRAAALLTAATVAVALATPVAAAPLEHSTFHDEFSFVVEDFCGAGIDVQAEGVVDGRLLVNRHGRDGLVYFMEHVQATNTLTNLANGKSVSGVDREVHKDLHVTDNGDGTLTVLELLTGNFTLYDEDGKAIARNPGQVRIEHLIDHAGTPDDPSDDLGLADTLVKGSTGRNDDVCEAAVAALT